MALSNYDILEMGRQMDLNIVGVFSKDRLPKDYQVGSYYINLENSNEGNGTHWAYAEIFDDGKALYFDPFGTLAPIEVKDWLKPFRPYPTSNRHIQDNNSDKCGYFCLSCDVFFTYDTKEKKSLAENYDDFLNMFSINKKLNDTIVMEYLKGK